jgi:hypothetical protein
MNGTFHTAVFAKTNPAQVHVAWLREGYPISNMHPECGTHNRTVARSIDKGPVTCEKCLDLLKILNTKMMTPALLSQLNEIKQAQSTHQKG